MYALAYFYIHPEFAGRNIWKTDNQTAKEVNERQKCRNDPNKVHLSLIFNTVQK